MKKQIVAVEKLLGWKCIITKLLIVMLGYRKLW